MIQFLLHGCIIIGAVIAMGIQLSAWAFSIGRLLKGNADREDVALLIPGVAMVVIAYFVAKAIPKALATKPNDSKEI